MNRIRTCVVVGGLLLCCGLPQASFGSQRGASGSAKVASAVPVLDLNSATPAQIEALPGMGAAYARRVIEGRPYTAKNQLVTRGVLPASAYDRIKDLIVARRPGKDSASVEKRL